ncbi:MAG: CCA tRNA nucleotidyltransferase [Rhodospirillales bacterium]
MEPTGKIAPQEWMTRSETRAVIAALTAENTEVRFVGGCVRDAVLKRPVQDVDIATPDSPEKVMALLKAAGIKAIPTGIDHGTVTAVIGPRHYEITTLRIDVETDGRRAKIAYTDDWIADAARRDFTINTLSATPEGDIYDPFKGLDDLGQGIVRFVGNARERIEEDILRLLRFFRFYAAYGKPPADKQALDACRSLAPKLSTLSAERIWSEFRRILLGPNPENVITLLLTERILDRLLPEAGPVGPLRMLNWLETTAVRINSVEPDPIRRLAALLDKNKTDADAVAGRLKLSNQAAERLGKIVAPAFDIQADQDSNGLKRLLYSNGAEIVRDVTLLSWAKGLSSGEEHGSARTKLWLGHLTLIDSWRRPEFPLKGQDVLALKVPPGPRVGELLGAVEYWWIDGNFTASREACLKKLQDLVV